MVRGVTVEAAVPRGAMVSTPARGVIPADPSTATWAGAPPIAIVDIPQAGSAVVAKLYTATPAFAFLIDDANGGPGAIFSAAETQRRLDIAVTVPDLTAVIETVVETDGPNNP